MRTYLARSRRPRGWFLSTATWEICLSRTRPSAAEWSTLRYGKLSRYSYLEDTWRISYSYNLRVWCPLEIGLRRSCRWPSDWTDSAWRAPAAWPRSPAQCAPPPPSHRGHLYSLWRPSLVATDAAATADTASYYYGPALSALWSGPSDGTQAAETAPRIEALAAVCCPSNPIRTLRCSPNRAWAPWRRPGTIPGTSVISLDMCEYESWSGTSFNDGSLPLVPRAHHPVRRAWTRDFKDFSTRLKTRYSQPCFTNCAGLRGITWLKTADFQHSATKRWASSLRVRWYVSSYRIRNSRVGY